MPLGELLLSMVANIGLNILSNRLDAFIAVRMPAKDRNRIWLNTLKLPVGSYVRISAAYLFRIHLNGQYLLIKGNRIQQYQPVGGVRKYYAGAQKTFRDLGVLGDDYLPMDETSRNDLRIRVPARKVLKFLEWYDTGEDREIDQSREFYEELVRPRLLPSDLFGTINTTYQYTVPTYHFSSHFRCPELLYHEVYELQPTLEQEQALIHLQASPSESYQWVKEEAILMLGHDKRLGYKPFNIGEHSKLLLSKNHRLF